MTLAHNILQEFAQLTPNNTVYKLIGPVLVQQDQAEAKTNVDTRLDFIQGEMWVLETHPCAAGFDNDTENDWKTNYKTLA